jgi:hypothetical protein
LIRSKARAFTFAFVFSFRFFHAGLPSLLMFGADPALLAAEFAHAVQAVDAHVEDVVVAVLQADRFLHAATGIDRFQSAEHADPVIDVDHQVAGFQLRQLLQRKRLRVLAEAFLQPVAVVALEDLVVGVERQLQLGVDEAFVQVENKRREGHLVLHVVEDGVEALALLRAVARDQVRVARVLLVVQVAAEDFEFLGEWWLRALLEVDHATCLWPAGCKLISLRA